MGRYVITVPPPESLSLERAVRDNELEVYEGLNDGDLVVSAGVAFLNEGMAVEIWDGELTGG